ncbi:hypothetical protein LN042_01690 [Kitasatospora sp. RB6PN24]|uniref:hypothetical protein n=1 Tax=Kitasatospora humi TaxID=2893891 RepID=UPI001E533D40|nr:hypothetical protein [Kitasatospora humi]MCC9305832.1 hypothetical protein [Kitasatospora humi]
MGAADQQGATRRPQGGAFAADQGALARVAGEQQADRAELTGPAQQRLSERTAAAAGPTASAGTAVSAAVIRSDSGTDQRRSPAIAGYGTTLM